MTSSSKLLEFNSTDSLFSVFFSLEPPEDLPLEALPSNLSLRRAFTCISQNKQIFSLVLKVEAHIFCNMTDKFKKYKIKNEYCQFVASKTMADKQLN
jgi:hypothetical protein